MDWARKNLFNNWYNVVLTLVLAAARGLGGGRACPWPALGRLRDHPGQSAAVHDRGVPRRPALAALGGDLSHCDADRRGGRVRRRRSS